MCSIPYFTDLTEDVRLINAFPSLFLGTGCFTSPKHGHCFLSDSTKTLNYFLGVLLILPLHFQFATCNSFFLCGQLSVPLTPSTTRRLSFAQLL